MGAWITPSGFLGTFTERVFTSTTVTAIGTGTIYKLISGNLPDGLTINSNGVISGTPSAVLKVTNSKFVLRSEQLVSGVTVKFDRTFNIDIFGPSVPEWNITQTQLSTSTRIITNNGITSTVVTTVPYLKIGINERPYVLNRQYVDFQFTATTVNTPPDARIKYYIEEGSGRLPPGLTLSPNGKLTGILLDKLTFDGNISEDGGYDTESYDGYTYDHSSTTSTQITGLPKSYKFYVTADDGVASSKQLFGILVVNPDLFRVDNTQLIYNTSTFFNIPVTPSSDFTSVQPVQFINGNNLGTARAANNYEANVSAYDPNPGTGPLRYSIITGTNILNRLPRGMYIERNSGYIFGYLPYQPAYSRTYSITVAATKRNSLNFKTTTTNVFTLVVEGEVQSEIKWVTSSTLGTLYSGLTSELKVEAEQINSKYSIKYTLLNGSLPTGLTLVEDGSISGKADYLSTGTFNFTVLASDVYSLSAIEREFSLDVIPYDDKKYTQIYVRPFLSRQMRSSYREFITNTFTFDPNIMYRYFDPNFGIQPDIKMYLEFGIEKLNIGNYATALYENFYRKKLYFGDVKLAYAKDTLGNIIYEVVYVDIVDELVNSKGQSVRKVLYSRRPVGPIYYPNSIDNMRKKLEQIVLTDQTYINTNQDSFPKFMQTAQEGDYKPPGFMRVVPICYTLPGQGAKVISRIKLSGFDFKMINFEIDRLIVENSLDYSTAKYLMFGRQTISDSLPTDDILFGPDADTSTNYITLVDLDTESGTSITRV